MLLSEYLIIIARLTFHFMWISSNDIINIALRNWLFFWWSNFLIYTLLKTEWLIIYERKTMWIDRVRKRSAIEMHLKSNWNLLSPFIPLLRYQVFLKKHFPSVRISSGYCLGCACYSLIFCWLPAVTSSKQWIHFFLSVLWPPTSTVYWAVCVLVWHPN